MRSKPVAVLRHPHLRKEAGIVGVVSQLQKALALPDVTSIQVPIAELHDTRTLQHAALELSQEGGMPWPDSHAKAVRQVVPPLHAPCKASGQPSSIMAS